MPRGARLDAPGTLHHVMIRGIERRNIFDHDQDREQFITRLGALAKDTETPIYGWDLMHSHVHLLLKSGNQPHRSSGRQPRKVSGVCSQGVSSSSCN